MPALLEARELQRLRRVRQTGLASLAYPGADHTRFAHAIGSACVMTRLVRRLQSIHDTLPYWQRLTTERARDALAAALLHDIGHGPFSHLFEQVLPQSRRHEAWTTEIVLDPSTDVNRILKRFDSSLPERVADLVQGKHELTFLAKAVSGTFDVDRCDYLLRDAHATGVSYGSFDLDWLLRSLRFGVPVDGAAPPLAIDGAKGIPAIESFLLARLFMFQQVYFHKTERASEWMLARILERVGHLAQDGVRLGATPRAISEIAVNGGTTLGEYLRLDDATLWVALASWCDAPDPLLANLCQRFYARQLFKTYELFGEQATPAARLIALEIARDIAKEEGLDPEIYVGLDAASTVAFDDSEDPLTVVFPNGKSRALSDVSFLLARLRQEKMERVRLVFAPELRDRIIRAVGEPSLGMKSRALPSLLALGFGSGALLCVPAARADEAAYADEATKAARRVHAPLPGSDGVYGRFDGTLALAASVGAELEGGEARGALKLSAHYLWTAGVYVRYSDAFGSEDLRPARVASLGIDVRPLFLPRFALDNEHGPAWLDLALDSFSLSAGAYFAAPHPGDFGDVRGFETGIGLGVPLCGEARGFWLDARAERRFADHGPNAWLFTLSVAYHALALSTDTGP